MIKTQGPPRLKSAEPQPLNLLHFPVVTLDAPRPAVAARSADTALDMIGSPSTSPTTDMYYLVTFAHRRSALDHLHHSAGEMNTTLSPRMTIVP
jgi:hypothetical protein